MANGHVKIHDPFTNHNGLKSDVDVDDDVTSEGMEDTVEFRLMMAYAKRRREEAGPADRNGAPSPRPPLIQSDTDVTDKKKKKKKKKGLRGWKRLFSCIKPRTHDEEPECRLPPQSDAGFRMGDFPVLSEDVEPVDELEEAATRLAEIADEVPFMPSELETDNPEDNVERLIGLLLREAGDRLNEQELRDVSLARELFWNYSFFKTLITELLRRMGLRSSDPDSPGPRASPKTQIAVTCEATSRLSALDTLPMNRLLGYGARFLNENYSSWVEEQGGYDAAFESDDEDEVH